LEYQQLQASFDDALRLNSEQTTEEMQRLLKEQNQRIEKAVKSSEVKRTDKINQTITLTIQNSMAGRIEKAVKSETKNTLLPTLQKSITTMSEGVSRTVNEQLAATKDSVNNHLQHVLRNDILIQGITNSLAATIQHLLPPIMEALYKTTLLPSFERSCQQMFVQLDESFRQGTRDYLAQIHEQQSRSQDPSLQQVNMSLQTLSNSFSSSSSPLLHLIQASMHNELSSLQSKLIESFKTSLVDTIKDELEGVIDERISSANSLSLQQQQERMLQLIQDKQFDMAFNIALSTSSLELVTYLCHQVSPDEVFNTNSQCPLSQPVLLSLIQQITVDLSQDIELKVRYLEHAIISLDTSDQVTSSHLPTVMQVLSEQLVKTEEKLKNDGQGTAPQLIRAMKRVRMLSEHVSRSCSGLKK
jgi:enhancer of mRNA-decapping protein 4